MSSPLRAFRKHQKKLIVFFGVLLMITFVLLGSAGVVDSLTRSTQRPGDEVRVTWKGGSLTDSELANLRVVHDRTSRFLLALRQQAIDADGQPKVDISGIINAGGEQNLADLMMMVQKAEEEGVVVDDAAVLRFFIEASDNTIKNGDQLESLYYEVIKRDLPFRLVVAHMRLQLAALAYQRMLGVGLVTSTPAENRDYFDRINVRRTVELFPIPVSDYVDQVKGKPSEEEIAAMYEEGKNRFPTKFGPDPGFRRRRQLKFDYFKGDEAKLREAAEAKITDEQVAQYYEEHKEDYKRPSLPSANDGGLPGTPIAPLQLPNLDDALLPEDSGDDNADNNGTSTDEKNLPEGDKQNSSEGTKTSGDNDATPTKGDDSSNDDVPPSPPANDASSNSSTSQFQREEYFVSLLDDEAEATEDTAPSTTPDTISADAPKSSAPKKDFWAGGAKTPAKKNYWKLPDETGSVASGDEEKPLSKYRSLEEVESEIRRKLAEEALTAELNETDKQFKGSRPFAYLIEKKLKAAQSKVTQYSRSLNRWQRKKTDGVKDEDNPKPLQPDWDSIADDLDLVFGETELVDATQIGDTEIGKSSTFSFAGGRMRQISFAEFAFSQQSLLFQPHIFPQFGAQRYAYWQVEEVEEKIPTLEEARDDVIAAWKFNKARILATSAAEEKAKEAADSDKTFKDLFGDDAFEPPPFAWMSSNNQAFGQQGATLTPSFVPGVETPGNTFHKDVGKLDLNETGIALNQPEDTVFVVRVNQVSQFVEYLDTPLTSAELTQIGQSARGELAFESMRAIAKGLDVKWIPRERNDN